MKAAVFGMLLAFAAAEEPAAASAANANPLAKVIQLMDDLFAKIVKQGEEADLAYREYKNWCDDAASDKRFEIKTLTAQKGKLDASIGKLTSDISECDSNIDALVKSIATATKELKDATAFSSAGKTKLMALVQSSQGSQSDEDQEPGAPAATVYKSHSADLLELLEDLKEKAEEDLAALRKAETNAKQNYEMLKQSLDDVNKNGEKDLADEKDLKKKAEEEKANDEKELGMTTKSLAEAESTLATYKAECMQVAADHETSVAGRNEELKTIEMAKKVLQETTTGAVEQSYSLVQLSRQQSRLSLKSD